MRNESGSEAICLRLKDSLCLIHKAPLKKTHNFLKAFYLDQLVRNWNLCLLRAVLCKNRTKWEMKNFEHPTQIYMEVGPHEGCSKMSIIEVITQLLPW